MSMGDGKAKNLLEYLDNLVEKGKATAGAIKPLRTTFKVVLTAVDGGKWESIDVREIDADDYMNRFANLTMGKYSTGTLGEYKARVSKVIRWYINFLDKPGWAPDVQKHNRAPKPAELKVTNGESSPVRVTQPSASIAAHQTMTSVANTSDRVLYPYPLSDGQLVHISLPVKLSKKDAVRIGTFIQSIAIDEPLALGPGNHE